MDSSSNRSRQSAPVMAESLTKRPEARNFHSLHETIRAITARSTELGVAGKVAPLFRGQFLSAGLLRISDGSLGRHRQPDHGELLFVLEGEADFRVDSEVRRVRAGDFIVVPRDTVHGCEAIHSDALSLVSIFSPQFDLARDVIWEDGGEPPRYQVVI